MSAMARNMAYTNSIALGQMMNYDLIRQITHPFHTIIIKVIFPPLNPDLSLGAPSYIYMYVYTHIYIFHLLIILIGH